MTTNGPPPDTPDSPDPEGDGSNGTDDPGPPAKARTAGKTARIADARDSRRVRRASAKSRTAAEKRRSAGRGTDAKVSEPGAGAGNAAAEGARSSGQDSPEVEGPGKSAPSKSTEELTSPGHLNARPGWDCTVCGAPWPCGTARGKLLEEFGRSPSVLTIYMSAQMYDAFSDLVTAGHLAPANLFERFIGWARKAAIVPDDPNRGERHGESETDHQETVAA